MAYWLDDGFDTWAEVAAAGAPAVALYVRCGAWIARSIATGRVTDAVVPGDVARMYGSVEWAQRLVDVGLWAADGAGYRDLRHFDLNPTPEQLAAMRAKKAAAGRKGGLARAAKGKQQLSNGQARASPSVKQPLSHALSPPSTKEERATRASNDVNPWPEDPRAIAEDHERLRQLAEERAHALAVADAQNRAGAARARQVLKNASREST